MSETPFLQIYGLEVATHGTPLLQEVSLELERGKVTTVVGPNGSGKTTLLKAIAGLLPEAWIKEGMLRCSGADLLSMTPAQRAARVIYLSSDSANEFPLTVREVIQLGRLRFRGGFLGKSSLQDAQAVERSAELCGCTGLLERNWMTLSGGERQLAHLARALAQEAQMLLLDEAFSRLDLQHQASVGQLLIQLAAEGKAILWVSHDLNFAFAWSQQFLLLRKGRIVRGPSADPINPEEFEKLYPGFRPTSWVRWKP